MRRIHQIPTVDLHRFPDLGSYAIVPTLMMTHGDVAFHRFAENVLIPCNNVFLVVPPSYRPTVFELEYCTAIWIYGRPFHLRMCDPRNYEYSGPLIANVVVGSYEEVVEDYEWLCKDSTIAIGFPRQRTDAWGNVSELADGFNRFSYIYRMVQEKKLKHKRDHYLFSLDNPAELVAYSNMFTSGVQNSFKGVTSVRCYVDSKHGIEYLPKYGLLTEPILDGNLEEGMHTTLQVSLFRLNDGWIKSFIEGRNGEDVLESYNFKIEEGIRGF